MGLPGFLTGITVVLPWFYHDLRLGIPAVKIKHNGCDTRCTPFFILIWYWGDCTSVFACALYHDVQHCDEKK